MKSSDTHYRTTLNAIPIPAFVVDDDVAVLRLNHAASQFCGQSREAVYQRRGGEILHCAHSTDVPEGCGRGPHCQFCGLRHAVTKCLHGQAVSRKIMNFHRAHDPAVKDLQWLVTASPIADESAMRALVMVEDITTRRETAFNISPATPLQCGPAQRQPIDWNPRPRALREFPDDTHLAPAVGVQSHHHRLRRRQSPLRPANWARQISLLRCLIRSRRRKAAYSAPHSTPPSSTPARSSKILRAQASICPPSI